MSINSINRSQTPLTETRQTAAAAKAGNHNDRVVSQAMEQTADNYSLSSSIPRSNIRSRSVRRPTSNEHTGLFNTLRLCFGKQQPRNSRNQGVSGPTRAANLEANTMAMVKGKVDWLIESAQKGIAAAKSNVVEGLAEGKSSAEVASFLESGDRGIRKGTTAIHNLGRMISFTNLSDAEKQKLPDASLETLEQQSTQIKGMAKTISDATFLDGKYNFFQCGNSANNGYTETMKTYPDHDQAMRNWVRSGLNLGSELINAQEQIILEGKGQSEDYLEELQSRVNIFALTDPFAPLDTNKSEMEGFTNEVLSQIE